MEQSYSMRVIARVHSGFPTKFGIPRQSGLVEELEASVVFEPEFRNRDALRGLEGFSHLWLLWVFDRNLPTADATQETGTQGGGTQGDGAQSAGTQGTKTQGTKAQGTGMPSAGTNGDGTARAVWSPTVRPPRLGGNRRMGVFATRSPFRPNPIGLSCVALAGIEDTAEGPVLRIRGADLADGTPVLDIKPYLPYADCIPSAVCGYAPPPGEALDVEIPPDLLDKVPAEHRAALYGILAQDPRPRYQEDPERVYGFGFAGMEIRFTVDGTRLTVREVAVPENCLNHT